MCAGPVDSPCSASAQEAAAGTLSCSSVSKNSGVRSQSDRFGMGGIITPDSVLTARVTGW